MDATEFFVGTHRKYDGTMVVRLEFHDHILWLKPEAAETLARFLVQCAEQARKKALDEPGGE